MSPGTPDLVLLDIDLGGESGLDLAPRLARTAGFPHKSMLSGQALLDPLGPDFDPGTR